MCAIAADADPIRAKLDTAKKVYTEAIAMHGKELLDTLQKKDDEVRKAGNLQLVEQLKKEKTTFETEGELPTMVPSLAYLNKMRQSKRSLDTAFRQAIKECLVEKLDNKAAEIEVELKQVLAAHGGDWLRVGDVLVPGESLISRRAQYELKLLTDGNLVIYRLSPSPTLLWSTKTSGKGVATCTLLRDGNLVLKTNTGRIIWSSNTGGRHAIKLIVQDDGNVVSYDKEWKSIWSSGTDK